MSTHISRLYPNLKVITIPLIYVQMNVVIYLCFHSFSLRSIHIDLIMSLTRNLGYQQAVYLTFPYDSTAAVYLLRKFHSIVLYDSPCLNIFVQLQPFLFQTFVPSLYLSILTFRCLPVLPL